MQLRSKKCITHLKVCQMHHQYAGSKRMLKQEPIILPVTHRYALISKDCTRKLKEWELNMKIKGQVSKWYM